MESIMVNHLNKNEESPKRVIILGGNGFVGRALNKKLKDHGVDVLSYSSHELDLVDENATEKLGKEVTETDTIVFLSCLTPHRGRDVGTLMKNLSMANNVSKVVSEKKVSQMIYISSDALYDTNSNPVNEETKPVLGDLYSYMHLGREIILKEACKHSESPLCILRPVAMFGEGSPHNSYGPVRFENQALNDKKIPLFGEGEEQRDHLAVEDFAEVIWQCLTNRTEGLLNVATGKSVPFMAVAEKVKSAHEGVEIECKPRNGGSISHMHFDNTQLMKAFPNLNFKSVLG